MNILELFLVFSGNITHVKSFLFNEQSEVHFIYSSEVQDDILFNVICHLSIPFENQLVESSVNTKMNKRYVYTLHILKYVLKIISILNSNILVQNKFFK